jgi:dienelactone hydrolase
MGLVRYHAAEWHVDPHKIGVLGFSAGGYLVAEISTRYDHRLYTPVDAADKVSCRGRLRKMCTSMSSGNTYRSAAGSPVHPLCLA